eukprot:g5530.t1
MPSRRSTRKKRGASTSSSSLTNAAGAPVIASPLRKKIAVESFSGSPRAIAKTISDYGLEHHLLNSKTAAVSSGHMAFVVKLFVTMVKPNYSTPWQMGKQKKSTSTGFVISGRRILTNAHCVAYQTSVKVRKHGSAKKVKARVVQVGHDCDLALLTVDDDKFWEGDFRDQYLELDETLPALQDSVSVVGYPTGGENLSVTAGVISRVDMQRYSHSDSSLLTIQIDAAINSGNSGGPAFHRGKVVGIAFETLDEAENIGYIIPVSVANHFLDEADRCIKTGKPYVGFGVVGTSWQCLENPSLREFLKMSEGDTGPMVANISPLSHAHKVLKPRDVILEIDGHSVADDGTVAFRGHERLAFKYHVTSKFVGDYTTLKVVRNGRKKTVKVKVTRVDHLVPSNLYDKLPEYLVHAGFVFTALSEPYMHSEYGKSWMCKAPVRFVKEALYGKKTKEGEQIVVLTTVLSHDINSGYTESMSPRRVITFNDESIRNLYHLACLVRNCRAKYLRFGLSDKKVVVLDRVEAEKSNAEIFASHNIPKAMSDGLHGESDPVGVGKNKAKRGGRK